LILIEEKRSKTPGKLVKLEPVNETRRVSPFGERESLRNLKLVPKRRPKLERPKESMEPIQLERRDEDIAPYPVGRIDAVKEPP
jgi:hypothetical protein